MLLHGVYVLDAEIARRDGRLGELISRNQQKDLTTVYLRKKAGMRRPSFPTNLRARLDALRVSYAGLTFSACQPLGPLTTLKVTRWPSWSDRKP